DVGGIPRPFGGRVVHVGDAGAVDAGAFDVAPGHQDAARLEVGVGGQNRFGDAVGQGVKTLAVERAAQRAGGQVVVVAAGGRVGVRACQDEVVVAVAPAQLRSQAVEHGARQGVGREGEVA